MGVSVGVGVVPGGAVGVAIARGRDTAWVQADRATVTANATARYPRTIRRYNEHCDLWFRSALAQESGANLVGELNAASRQPHLAISLQQQASPHQMAPPPSTARAGHRHRASGQGRSSPPGPAGFLTPP